MKARELVNKRIDQVEGKLKSLNLMVSRGSNVREFRQEIKNTEEILEDLRAILEREPRTPNEINRY